MPDFEISRDLLITVVHRMRPAIDETWPNAGIDLIRFAPGRVEACDLVTSATLDLPDAAFPRIAVPFDQIRRTLATLPNAPLRLTAKRGSLFIKGARIKVEIPGFDIDDLRPLPPLPPTSIKVDIAASAWRHVWTAATAAASEPSLPALEGVHLSPADDRRVRVLATDRRRIHHTTLPTFTSLAVEALIPAPFITDTAEHLSRGILLTVDPYDVERRRVALSSGPLTYTSELIPEPFPDVTPLLNATRGTAQRRAYIDRRQGIDALEVAGRATGFTTWTPSAAHGMCVAAARPAPNHLNTPSNWGATQRRVAHEYAHAPLPTTTVLVDVAGDMPHSLAFDTTDLLDALTFLNSDVIAVNWHDPARPVLLTAGGLEALLMPVNVIGAAS